MNNVLAALNVKFSKLGITLFTVMALVFSNCEIFPLTTSFDLAYTSSVTVPKTGGLNLPFDLFTPEVTTNSESQFAVNDTRKDLLEEVTLTQMTLTITSPSSQRFDFLKEMSVYLNAEGLSEIKIASADNIPENIGATLEMDVVENDLKEYIKKDKFSLRVETVTDKTISEDVDIDIFSNFFVRANLIQ